MFNYFFIVMLGVQYVIVVIPFHCRICTCLHDSVQKTEEVPESGINIIFKDVHALVGFHRCPRVAERQRP